jgi:hypothetical protein
MTRAAVLALLVLSAAHFYVSGVRGPLSLPKIGQILEEIPPLEQHIRDGAPVRSENPRQYGPVFFFVMQPVLAVSGGDREALAHWLYALDLACVAAAFALTWLTLRSLMRPGHRRGPAIAFIALAALWLNFAPMYAILNVKNVEGWELFLMCVALYALVNVKHLWRQRAIAGGAIAAAGLIKLLPFAFFFYFLLRDRRALAMATAALAALLLAGQMTYGSQMGVLYLPRVARSAAGASFGIGWHENNSLKGVIAKSVGRLTTGTMHVDDVDPAYGADTGAGQAGYTIVLTRGQLAFVRAAGLAGQLGGAMWLAWMFTRSAGGADRVVWEWSMMAVMMLILSPQTAIEYTTLALTAFSYILVRLIDDWPSGVAWPRLTGAAATLLVGGLVPRQALNRIVPVDALMRSSGYTHSTPSEAYQFFGFPFLGLLLTVICLWQLRPSQALHAAR